MWERFDRARYAPGALTIDDAARAASELRVLIGELEKGFNKMKRCLFALLCATAPVLGAAEDAEEAGGRRLRRRRFRGGPGVRVPH
ncbi:MAG: hypothetical protein IPK56_11040 [Elusimicrobia bacterium]|nr:hypothetical protein [Elusimicrobiota bacterium]